MRKHRLAVCLAAAVALSGCGSIAKGVTEAFLESGDDETESICRVEGPESNGLADLVYARATGDVGGDSHHVTQVLLVHGIGEHKPGYSARLRDNLTEKLKMNVRYGRDRRIPLYDRRADAGEDDRRLGSLRLSHYLDESESRRIVFYELTWSQSVERQRELLAFDTSGEYASRRTGLNNAAKAFFNERVVDPMMYLGNDKARERIRESVQQSICFMVRDGWGGPPDDESARTCRLEPGMDLGHAENDDFVFITHSLGSAIVIDSLEDIVRETWSDNSEVMTRLKEIFREKEIKVYMMANQLRLLEITGSQSPRGGETGETHEIDCRFPDTRIIRRTSIYAFNDPNDILSYEISPSFADQHLDPGLCARITNITLNVAEPISVFGFEFANPASAHSDYDDDERVIALMADGINREKQSEITGGRCHWVRSKDPEAGKMHVAGEMPR